MTADRFFLYVKCMLGFAYVFACLSQCVWLKVLPLKNYPEAAALVGLCFGLALVRFPSLADTFTSIGAGVGRGVGAARAFFKGLADAKREADKYFVPYPLGEEAVGLGFGLFLGAAAGWGAWAVFHKLGAAILIGVLAGFFARKMYSAKT